MNVQDCIQMHPNVTVVAVTKNRTIPEILPLFDKGISVIAENRVQEAESKFSRIPADIQKHLIGHLQTNKVAKAVALFDMIQSVDSVRLAHKIDTACAKIGKTMPILLQVNIAEDPAKFGFAPAELVDAISQISVLKNISVCGLMTIGALDVSEQKTRADFAAMHALFEKHREHFGENPILSMGMSNDYELAIEAGANMVRIGRALF